jgi:hypothetical protein
MERVPISNIGCIPDSIRVYVWRDRLYIYHTTYMGATPEPSISFEEEPTEQESRVGACSFCGPCKVKLCIFLLF